MERIETFLARKYAEAQANPAFEEGRAAGLMFPANHNPYFKCRLENGYLTMAYRAWAAGYHRGRVEAEGRNP